MEKSYLSHIYDIETEASGLLGFFDDENSYILEDGIVKELIECNKQIVSYDKEKIVAKALVGDYNLDFIIYLQDGEGCLKRAGLFLVEKAKLGAVEKEFQTYVDSFVEHFTPMFFENIKRKYHLYTVDESEGIDIKNSKCIKILGKKSDLAKKYKAMLPLMVGLEKEYVKKMLSVIKTSGKSGEIFINNLKQLLNDKNIKKNSPTYWRDVRMQLDKMIRQNEKLFELKTEKRMNNIQKMFLGQLKEVKLPQKEASKGKAKKAAGGKAKKMEAPGAPSINYNKLGESKKEKAKGSAGNAPSASYTKITYKKTVVTADGQIRISGFEMFGMSVNAEQVKDK